MGYLEKYEIVKGKDKCYDSLRKSLAKLSSALNKAKYINKGAYATLFISVENDPRGDTPYILLGWLNNYP